MGFWSKVKKAAKKVWRKVKSTVRVIVKVVVDIVLRIIKIYDLVFGFLGWPKKKMLIRIVVLSKLPGPAATTISLLNQSIDHAKKIFKKMNVEIKPFEKEYIEFFDGKVPGYVKTVHCGEFGWGAIKDEFRAAGEFFNKHRAKSTKGPITVYVVEDVVKKLGCSLGPLSDYVTLDHDGVQKTPHSTMAHEFGHCCGLIGHPKKKINFMYKSRAGRGEHVSWYQKNIIRSSRHVNYW